MKRKTLSKIFNILASVAIVVGSFTNTTVFAAEETSEPVTEITDEPIITAGTETLPLGWYLITQHFTVYNDNLSPVKTVQGRYLKLKFNWMVADTDTGLGGEIITIQIRDAITGQTLLTDTSSVSGKWILKPYEHEFDLGYAGRQIQIYTDVSSNGVSNGNYRSADFYNYQSYVHN